MVTKDGGNEHGKIVCNVARSTATGKHVNVGDFGSIQAAHDAMIEHYRHPRSMVI